MIFSDPAAGGLLQSVVVPSGGQTTVTFSNIPQGFTLLEIVGSAADTTASAGTLGYVTLNSDTGSNYSRVYVFNNGGSFSSPASNIGQAPTSVQSFVVAGATNTPYVSFIEIKFPAPSLQGVKVFHATSDDPQTGNQLHAGIAWNNGGSATPAITTITLTAQTKFAQGTVFTLRGYF